MTTPYNMRRVYSKPPGQPPVSGSFGSPNCKVQATQAITHSYENVSPLSYLRRKNERNSISKQTKNHDGADSTLDQQTKASIEDLLVQFNDIFARHRFDTGINNDFKVKLAPV